MKTSLKIMNAILFASLLIQPSHATGSTGGDFLSNMTPALKQLGSVAMQSQQAKAAQESAQTDSKKEDFANMVADKQAAAVQQQQQAASVVKGFPMLDPHSAYLSEGYKNQRNAMFQRSINKAAADFKRANETTQAALAAEESMTQEAMGAVSGVVGKLADQMNKSDEEADKVERAEFVTACAQAGAACKPDGKGNMVVNGKKMKIDDKLEADIKKVGLEEISNDTDAINMEKYLNHKGSDREVGWSLNTSSLTGFVVENTNDPGQRTLMLNCGRLPGAEMTFNAAKGCYNAAVEFEKNAKERLATKASDDRHLAKIQNELKAIVGFKDLKVSEQLNSNQLRLENLNKCTKPSRVLERFLVSYNALSEGSRSTDLMQTNKDIYDNAKEKVLDLCAELRSYSTATTTDVTDGEGVDPAKALEDKCKALNQVVIDGACANG